MLPPSVDQTAGAVAETPTTAEVLEVREIASVTYDPAKRTARLARAEEAHDDLVQAAYRCRRMPSRSRAAKRRLADEYDAAQARGEVARRGYTGHQHDDPDRNVIPSAAELGLARKRGA
jgi:hypothetical protein